MDTLLQVLTVFCLPALVTAISWCLIRWLTGSTKYAWAMAIAVGYLTGHAMFSAWGAIDPETEASKWSSWLGQISTAFQNVLWPQTAVDWLPIGALLAGLVSVNAAAFDSPRIVAICGAVLVTLFIFSQCLWSAGLLNQETLMGSAGIRLVAGMLGVLACWLSLNHSIEGRSRWAWIGSVSVLTIAVVLVLGLSGHQAYATLAIVVLCTIMGTIPVCLWNGGTDNVRFAGAAIAASSVGLLMMAWWVSEMPWYPVAILVAGYAAVAYTPPIPFGTMMTRRLVTSGTCAVAAVLVAVFVK